MFFVSLPGNGLLDHPDDMVIGQIEPLSQIGLGANLTELILNGGRRVIEALLPVLDDLERAQDNMGKATDVEALKEGVDLILTKLDKTLSGQGLKKIDTTDALFDTDFHEAIAMVPAADDSQKGKVIDCVQTGYMLGETVIRHAKVAVGQ